MECSEFELANKKMWKIKANITYILKFFRKKKTLSYFVTTY